MSGVTLQERVAEIYDTLCCRPRRDGEFDPIANLVEFYVAEEREAVVQIVELFHNGHRQNCWEFCDCDKIIEAIRKRA